MAKGLGDLPPAELFARYRAILLELKRRGTMRTENAPANDYAEYLVATALDGELQPNSNRAFDVLLDDGSRLQVKTRVVSEPMRAGQDQLSVFRSFEFDWAVIVLLRDSDFRVSRAGKVPIQVVQRHVNTKGNGDPVLEAKVALADGEAVDLTEALRHSASRV